MLPRPALWQVLPTGCRYLSPASRLLALLLSCYCIFTVISGIDKHLCTFRQYYIRRHWILTSLLVLTYIYAYMVEFCCTCISGWSKWRYVSLWYPSGWIGLAYLHEMKFQWFVLGGGCCALYRRRVRCSDWVSFRYLCGELSRFPCEISFGVVSFVVSQASWGKSSSQLGCDGPDTCFWALTRSHQWHVV